MITSLNSKLSKSLVLFSFFATSSAFAQKLSDNTLKKDATPVKNSVKQLTKLEPVSFSYYKAEFDQLPEGKQYGFLASDVKAVFPELVKNQSKVVAGDGKNATKSVTIENVDMVSLIPLLVSSIKEQQAEIEKLKSELNALKRNVSAAK